jgi:hypothetical protein
MAGLEGGKWATMKPNAGYQQVKTTGDLETFWLDLLTEQGSGEGDSIASTVAKDFGHYLLENKCWVRDLAEELAWSKESNVGNVHGDAFEIRHNWSKF